ncbi:MAG TPA: PIG-L deacetylase family protein [Acidimicrobiales bacterium]|nr:PIG-L deacetylase family protein [Acidimicrobiales bacterium]
MSRPVFSRSASAFVEDAIAPLNPALKVMVVSALCRVGTDVTDVASRRACLVVAPHPDDETLGAGATIMRKVDAGTPVHLVVATDGSKAPVGDPVEVAAVRRAELYAACAVLGLTEADVTWLGFVDAELAGTEEELAAAIATVVGARRPAEVLVTGESDPHEDHAVLGAATRRALAGTGVGLLSYPVWQFDRPARLLRQLRRGLRPELVRTDGYRQRKRDALACYPSQMAAGNDDPEGLRPNFLPNFDRPYEMFFPVPLDVAAGDPR